MKFVSFRAANGLRPGFLSGQEVVCISSLWGALRTYEGKLPLRSQNLELYQGLEGKLPTSSLGSMREVIKLWASFGQDLLTLFHELGLLVIEGQILAPKRAEIVRPENRISLGSPLPNPTSLRDGYAFRQHVETMRRNRGVEMIPEFDLFPVFYFGNHQAIFGPGDFPVQERHLEELDYELEVAIVIGKEGRNIRAKDADRYVFGLCIMNDMSARALQREEMKLSLGPAKGKDFGTILGPYLVTLDDLARHTTASERGNAYDLRMTCAVNGNPLSEGNASSMNWTFAEIIERASYGVTLYPGDVIGSGTVGTGCLAELNSSKITSNLWLKPGDVVTMEIDELGTLENRIVLVDAGK